MSRRPLFDAGLKISVHAKDVIRNASVPLFLDVVCHNEEQVETGKKGIGERDVLVRVFVDVVLRNVSKI